MPRHGNGNTHSARLRDVAKAAKVSVSTASRALKDDPRISQRTRERVHRHASRLDYRADLVARSLSLRRTFTVGLIVGDIGNPFYADLARGVETVLHDAGYIYFLGDSNGQAELQREIARRMVERRVDGLLVTVPHDRDVLTQKHVPVAGIGRCPPGTPYVTVDHVMGATLAVEHLVEMGYRRIGMLLGEPSLTPVIDRRKGYRKAIAAAGMGDPLEVVCPDITYEAAYIGAHKLVESGADAIFAISDTLAVAAMAAVMDSHKRVPGDIGIVGYDDTAMAGWPFFNLTSVAQSTTRVGEEAARMILRLIEDGGASSEPVVLPPHLVVRGSSRGPLHGRKASPRRLPGGR